MTGSVEVAAVVVLFHPDEQVVENVASYVRSVAVVYAIDNTPGGADSTVVDALKGLGVCHVPIGDNLGVATALNEAARRAVIAGQQYLIMFDQDSKAFCDMISPLVSILSDHPNVALAAASQYGEGLGQGFYDVDATITSGSLLRLSAWTQLGPFFDELFIDLVDDEYCLRVRRAGMRVVKSREALLIHKIGNLTVRRWFWLGRVSSPDHSALRRYYIQRNTIVVGQIYGKDFPAWWAQQRAHRRRELELAAAFEKNRIAKFRMAWRGARDGNRHILGRFDDALASAEDRIRELRDYGKLSS